MVNFAAFYNTKNRKGIIVYRYSPYELYMARTCTLSHNCTRIFDGANIACIIQGPRRLAAPYRLCVSPDEENCTYATRVFDSHLSKYRSAHRGAVIAAREFSPGFSFYRKTPAACNLRVLAIRDAVVSMGVV